jgi:RHS repeat-associated protein
MSSMYKALLWGALFFCSEITVIAQTPVPPPGAYIVPQIAVVNNGNGTQTVTYTWSTLPGNIGTVLLLYAPLGSNVWVNPNTGSPISPQTATIPTGNYQYAIGLNSISNIVLMNGTIPSPNYNYLRTWDATAPEQIPSNLIVRPLTDVKQATQYFDGLGRPLQTVAKQASPAGNDMVSPVTYDALGRETYKYLSFASNAMANAADVPNDGNFKSDPYQQQASFYSDNNNSSPIKGQGETFYYGQNDYEPSPLKRVTKAFAPGNSWTGSRGTGAEKATQLKYLANNATDAVIIWTVGSAPSGVGLQVAVSNNGNGTQNVVYTWNTLPADASTVLLLYSPLGNTPTWTDASAGGTGSPRSAVIPTGNYQYAIQIYYNDGTPNIIVPVTNGSITTYTTSANYAPGQLFKNITLDEQNNQVVEFKDMEGKTILKKVQAAPSVTDGYTGWLCTYYIYDDFGLLRLVMPPLATNAYLGGQAISTFQDELCFRYEYDQRHRMIIKKVPGAGEVWMVYDARNRVVLTQDANARAGVSGNPANQWIFIKYDGMNRPVITGLYTDNTNITQAGMQSYLNAQNLGLFETFTPGAFPEYTLTNSFPSTTSASLLTCNYYDDYGWVASAGTSLASIVDASGSSNFLAASSTVYPYPQALTQAVQTKSLLTGNINKVIGKTNQFLYSVIFYDDHKRSIQTQSINITGGKDIATTQYDWSGKPLRTLLQHQKSGTNPQSFTVLMTNSYDAMGRILSTTKSVSNALASTAQQTVTSDSYDELGQLRNKILGNNIDNLTYDYNIRGWMLGINRAYLNAVTTPTNPAPGPGNFFGMELGYDKNTLSASGAAAPAYQFSGNISRSSWKSAGDGIGRKYDFAYDNVNRLSAAVFLQNTNGSSVWDNAIDFSVSGLSYDANGNILGMNQNGFKVGAPASLIDQLTYTYLPYTNKLKNVIDPLSNYQTLLGNFRYSQTYTTTLGGNKTPAATDYAYDANGNLTQDLNKDMPNTTVGGVQTNAIQYNYLNLPQLITVSKGTIQYIYDAGGNKLQKITTEPSGSLTVAGNPYLGSIITTTTYIAGFVYETKSFGNSALNALTPPVQHTDLLQFISHEEGRVRVLYNNASSPTTLTGYAFDYFEKDHLGNIRMVLTDEAETDPYLATMETGNAQIQQNEQMLFGNLPATRIAKPGGMDNNGSNQFVALTNYTGNKIGPSLLLKVMAGDKLAMQVDAYYITTSGNNNNVASIAATDILTNLIAGITLTGGSEASATELSSSPVLGNSATSFISSGAARSYNASYPKAYLNYVFFDAQFKYAGGYATQVGSINASTMPPPQARTIYGSPLPVTAPKDGFVYVFVSNESNYNVYFDNLQVNDARGPILEQNHYYPFGLTMAGISDRALKTQYVQNKYLFNAGTELQNKEFSDGSGLELYETHFRSLDPQLGRFWQIDPLTMTSASLSPYQFGNNNPISLNDPFGLDTVKVNGEGVHHIKIKQGDVLAWTIGKTTSYYTYDPGNKNAVDGFVGGGVNEGSMAAVTITGSKTSDNTTPWQLGVEWVTGHGPREHHFRDNDPFTRLLQNHQHIDDTRDLIANKLANHNIDLNKKYSNNYSLGGISGVPKYLRDYSTLLTGGLTGNLAVTFLGSYGLQYEVVSTDEESGTAEVHFSVSNTSTIESATHPPVIGYTQWWSNNIGKPLNNYFSTGPLSPTTQTVEWTETIKYK